MSHRVLCPVDLTEGSKEALRAAIRMAMGGDSSLLLVHVWQSPFGSGAGSRSVSEAGLLAESRAHAEHELALWKIDAEQLGAARVTTTLLTGKPWREIVDVAMKDQAIHIIVMGTHGRIGLEHAVLGSVAEKVVRHAPCSVLVVRPQR